MTTVGVLGSGQLGRMLALAGLPLGIRCRVLDPSAEAPAAAVAQRIPGDWADPLALERLADGASVVTYEFENVPLTAVEAVARRVPVRPGPEAIRVASDRLVEKRFIAALGGSVAPFAPVDDATSLAAAVAAVGTPAILKTRRQGYDGLGQAPVASPEEAGPAWHAIGGRPAVLERRVPFRRELALVAVRGLEGDTRFYPLVETRHRNGVLASAVAPAVGVPEGLRREAHQIASAVLDALAYVGVLTLELFDLEGRLLVNELAPRVHNSGHWTIEGAATSQFENHLRAILGLRLGDTAARGPSAVVNLLGTIPDPARILAVPDAHLHLYGKTPRPGRKLGHVTLRADRWSTLLEHARTIERLVAAP
jgi:5-(carboxyamino)imidazole ribonucleotide synthase